MKRWEAIKLFEDKAWDTTDKSIKDVTRYQSDPGQATAYMIGQLAIWQIRNDTRLELENAGVKFSERDFHYRALSQGSSPLSYLKLHMKKYAGCLINRENEGCDEILGTATADQEAKAQIYKPEKPWQPRPFHEHHE